MLKTSYVMWVCNLCVLKHQPQTVRVLQEAFWIRQVHSVFCRCFPAVLGPLHVFYLDMWVTLVRKKPTDHAIFDHLLWKNHTERVHLFDSLGFTIYFWGGLQTADISQSWDLNPIKAAKINGLAMAEVGAKKKTFLLESTSWYIQKTWANRMGKWLTMIIIIIIPRFGLIQSLISFMPKAGSNPLQIHLQQVQQVTAPTGHPEN